MAKPPVLYSFTGLKDIIWHQGYQMENILGWGELVIIYGWKKYSHCEEDCNSSTTRQSHSCKIQNNPSLGFSFTRRLLRLPWLAKTNSWLFTQFTPFGHAFSGLPAGALAQAGNPLFPSGYARLFRMMYLMDVYNVCFVRYMYYN
jgi:hypothetical protein